MSCSDHPSPSTRSLSEVSEDELIRLTLDLAAAARQNFGFLRDVAESLWLHHTPVLVEAVRRYDELWMPMISNLTAGSGKPLMILPPLDIEWVWFCYTLNPVANRQYSDSRFSKLIGKPAIFNQENKDYVLERCKEIWVSKYPSESFENEDDFDDDDIHNVNVVEMVYLLGEISKQRCLLTKFSKPYMLELVYLIAARN
ncbi:hypothetical protein L1987_48974 [Smallanthus sonchifolius]|uniref:Uncharacterized protein n=1 Tax=Smallanthus sonchifolius TaxID=185202 RepID=A0ACB9FT67_9ASTR|nr:hypothetical protein L1987_48974 [Smallanthus sonchifolius]